MTPTLCYFCYFPGVNLTAPTDLCQAGYYCVSGVDKANPLMLDSNQCPTGTVHPILGHICPMGHYCEIGSDFPVPCPAGKHTHSGPATSKPIQIGTIIVLKYLILI